MLSLGWHLVYYVEEDAHLPKAEPVGQPYIRDGSDEESLTFHEPTFPQCRI